MKHMEYRVNNELIDDITILNGNDVKMNRVLSSTKQNKQTNKQTKKNLYESTFKSVSFSTMILIL